MARTKRVTKPAAEKKGNSNAKIKELILKKLEENGIIQYIFTLNHSVLLKCNCILEQMIMNKLDKRMEEELKLIESEFLSLRTKFSKSVLNRTMAEIVSNHLYIKFKN